MFSTYALLYDPEVEKEEPTTEVIKDGTLDPSANGTLTDDDKNPGGEDPGEDDPNNNDPKNENPDDKNDPNDGGDDKNKGGSSVGSLTSSGSAKTGDATPIALLFGLMITACGALVVLRKKA